MPGPPAAVERVRWLAAAVAMPPLPVGERAVSMGSVHPAALTAEAAAWIRARLGAEGVDDSYVAFVARHLAEPDDTWRWCCGSHCDPCVQALARVVDAARLELAMRPAVRPGAEESA
jgi:bacterioferritin-associated ferredoxin